MKETTENKCLMTYAEIVAATIERCAQLAEKEGNLWSNDAKAIAEVAAAIRKLKDEP